MGTGNAVGMPDGDRKIQRDIAKLLGIFRPYESRIEKEAIGKLGDHLLEEDEDIKWNFVRIKGIFEFYRKDISEYFWKFVKNRNIKLWV